MRKELSCLILIFIIIFTLISCKQEPEVQIPQTPTLRGSVSIPSGADVNGSDFFIRVMEGERAVYTGKVNLDGSFSVGGLSEESTYSILLTTEEPGDINGSSKDVTKAVTSGYGGWLSDVTASLDAQAGVGSIKVKPLGTIKGIVKKDGSADGYDTTVYIPGTSYLAMTDGEGNYSIFNVPQSTYTLRYISNGYMAKMVDNVVLHSDSDTENPVTTVVQQILIKNAGNLVTTISKTGTTDHSNTTVMLSDGERTYTGSTGTDGALLISGIEPGTYVVTISSSGFITQTVEGIKIEAAKNTTLNPISLVANGGTITGSVIMNDGGDRAGVLITAKSSDEKFSYTTSTDEEGRFIIGNVYPGAYSLTITKSGYSTFSSGVVDSVAGQVSDVGSFVLTSRYGGVSGRVALVDSADNSGVTVTLTFIADPAIAPATISGADGTYTFSNLTNAGQYTLSLSKDGYVSDTGKVVDVTLGHNIAIDDVALISLTSTVTGKVTLEETEDYTGISVLLKPNDSSVQYDATTDQQGSYVMSRVNPGEYTLIVSKTGYVSKTIKSIIVESSTDKTLENITLNVGTRSITGFVTLELRNDYSGALITATNLSDSTVYSAISNSLGAYTLAGMKPGEYSITISCTGYNTVTLPTVNVTNGSEKNLEPSQLPIARGIILGTAILEGRGSNAGVSVELLKGTDVFAETTTDDSGLYSFSVPQGNYSGVRLSCENFKSVSIPQDIALIANNNVIINTNAEMTATHVPVVRGRLTVSGLLSMDYSGITVTLVENGMTTETDHDGYWSFDKVPVGHYTLKFERENTTDVTKLIDVVAAAEKTIESIELIPNAASIEGHVTLKDVSDYSNITVRATAEGMAELVTKTNAAGYFYLGNVITTETYTVHFEKDGWVSQTRKISGLENLSLNDITDENPVMLVDTTAPVLNSIAVTVGNSEYEGRRLNVFINAAEEGSGLDKVYVNTSNDFEGLEPISCADPVSCHVTDIEGSHTLYVKVEDKSGNQSAAISQVFTIADYKTVVSSVILDNEDGSNDGIVTWTKNKSPYYVTGNILVDENTTLIVEPGVNVQFSGAYFIQVEGALKIYGSESEKVYLYGVGAGENTWTGINVVHGKSEIHNAVITGMAYGIVGSVRIVDSILTAGSSGYALGAYGDSKYFSGSAENNVMTGKFFTKDAVLLKNEMESTDDAYADSWRKEIRGTLLSGNTLCGRGFALSSSSGENNLFSDTKVDMTCTGMTNCTFENSTVSIYQGGLYFRCIFEDCSFEGFLPAIVRESNIIDCGNIRVTRSRTEYEILDLSKNYWGVNNTAALNANGVNYNHSFLTDYYDDFNVTKLDVSGYATSAYTNIGYLGDEYYSEAEESPINYEIGDRGPAGGFIFYDKGYYSDGWRYLEAAPDDAGSYNFGAYRATANSDYLNIGTLKLIGAGRINTQRLVETIIERNAAKACADYTINGYDDWFLPSSYELSLMYHYRIEFGGGFSISRYYWSSSEASPGTSWNKDFYNGVDATNSSSFWGNVRPIRAF